MPNILWSLDFTPQKPPELNSFSKMLNKFYEQLARVINGNISFGNGQKRDNVNGNWVAVTTPAAPNTDFLVVHNLGRVPVGYIIATKSAAVDIYTGVSKWTETAMTLRATSASVAVNLFIF